MNNLNEHVIGIKLIRSKRTELYTEGNLYVNGKYFCDTIEDKDRGLIKGQHTEEDISKIKIYAKTAIPRGTYRVGLRNSPKFGDFTPHVLDVPGFTYILIHGGSSADSSAGCLIVGKKMENVDGRITTKVVGADGKVVNYNQNIRKVIKNAYYTPDNKPINGARVTLNIALSILEEGLEKRARNSPLINEKIDYRPVLPRKITFSK